MGTLKSMDLSGRFRLEQLLGRGAGSEIYSGLDLATGRAVAIKLAQTPVARAGLRREHLTLQSLRHPNLPEVLFLGETEGEHPAFLVRELVDGIPLGEFAGIACDSDVLAVLKQVAHVLAFLHGQGFVHGDVKPDNILVGILPEGGPWATLIDLGFSRPAETCEGELFQGTPFYSPVRLQEGTPRRPVDDVFALGRSFLSLGDSCCWETPLEELLRRSCAEDPDLRPGNAQVFLRTLDSLRLSSQTESPRFDSHPFVGREAETRELQNLVADPSVGLVSLEGEAGIGKSVLLDNLARTLEESGSRIIRLDFREEGSCPGHVLARRIAFSPEATKAEREELLNASKVTKGTPIEDSLTEDIGFSKQRLTSCILRVLEQLASRRKLVVFMDEVCCEDLDQHGPMVGVLRRVGDGVGIENFTFVIASRKGLGGAALGKGTRNMRLGPMEQEHAHQLALDFLALNGASFAPWTDEHEDLARRITRRSGGHPGFQESVQRSLLLRSGVSKRDLAGALGVSVPTSYAEAIDRCLAALNPDALVLLEALSVLSVLTEVTTLVELVDLSDTRRRAALGDLVRERLVEYERRGIAARGQSSTQTPVHQGFSVRSRVVASRVLERMTSSRLENLHARVVAVLTMDSSVWDKNADTVAYHALASKQSSWIAKTAPYAIRKLLQQGLPARAAELAERSLDILAQPSPGGCGSELSSDIGEVRRELNRLFADALFSAGETQRALEAYRFAEALGLEPGNFVRGRRRQADCLVRLGDWGGAEKVLCSMEQDILRKSKPEEHALLYASRARLAFRCGRPADASRFLQDGLALIDYGRHARVAAELWNNLGVVAFETSRLDEAENWHKRALDTRKRLGDIRGISISLGNLAAIYQVRGQMLEARRGYEEALKLKREIGEPVAIGSSLSNLGLVAQAMGDFEKALALNEEALSLRERVGDEQNRARSLEKLAHLMTLKGSLRRAAELAQTSIEVISGSGERSGGFAAALLNRAVIAIEIGHLDSAWRTIEQGLAVCHEVGLPIEGLLFEVRRSECVLLQRPGDDTASRHLGKSIKTLREMGDMAALGTALAIQAELALDAGADRLALEIATGVLELGLGSHNPVQVTQGRYISGAAKGRLGETSAASELLHSARREADRMGLPLLLVSIQAALASFHEAGGRFERASNWSRAVVSTLRKQLCEVGSRADEIAFVSHPRRAKILDMLERHSKGQFKSKDFLR